MYFRQFLEKGEWSSVYMNGSFSTSLLDKVRSCIHGNVTGSTYPEYEDS